MQVLPIPRNQGFRVMACKPGLGGSCSVEEILEEVEVRHHPSVFARIGSIAASLGVIEIAHTAKANDMRLGANVGKAGFHGGSMCRLEEISRCIV